MAASNCKFFRASALAAAVVAAGTFGAICFGAIYAPRASAQSAPAAVPVPFATALAGDGVAPSSANACSTAAGEIAATSGSAYSDGCVAADGLLDSPQGAAVDKYGNVYVADYSDRLVRVVYKGGAAVAAAITAANSGYAISATRNAPAPTPVVGNIYTIAGVGGGTGTGSFAALTATNGSGQFYCANYAATGQPVALDALGDGCPAASAPIGSRDVAVDNDGNLFLTDYTNSRVRVLCVNCAATTLAAKLITLENPGVTPVNGAMYTIAGYSTGYRDGPGFANATSATSTVALFRSPTQAVISSSEDVFVADNLDNAVRVLYNGGAAATAILTAEGYTGATAPVVGNVYTVVGDNCTQAPSTTNGSATTYECAGVVPGSGFTEETVSLGNGQATGIVWSVYLDANNNLFYTNNPSSTTDRVKVLYAGIAPPLTFPNATYTTLKTGDVYSFAGQGTGAAGTQNGVAPSAIVLSSAQSVSGDAKGNIFFVDYATGLFYETYAQNGLTAIIGGGNANAAPAAGAYCSGGTSGPQMTDAYENGCPLTQVKVSSPRGPVVADASGNLYFGDSVGYFLREFSYNPTFPTTAVGATGAAQPYAFNFLSAQTITAPSLLVDGGAANSFTDAGNDTCTAGLAAMAGAPGTTCVVNVAFTPKLPGLSAGAVALSSATSPLGAALFTGTATGAALSVDPGTSTTTGTGLVPNGIAVDGAGRVYVADSTSKSVLRYTGTTAATVATGFTAPSGVALDGAGDLFVADSTANTITEVPIAGTHFTFSSAAANPHGLAMDGLGNLYVADTGNNRILEFGPGAITFTVAPFTGLNAPQGVAVDSVGDIYAADSTHVAKLTPAGVQTTVASGGSFSGVAVDAAGNVLATTGLALMEYPASGGAAITLSSALISPKALALDGSGNAFLADNGYGGFFELQRTAGYFKFTFTPQTTTINLSSSGTSALTAPTYVQSDTTDFSLAPATTNGCSGALPSGATCALTASFNPAAAGTVTDSVSFTSSAANAPTTLTLTGTTVPLVPTLTLSVAPSTLTYGNTETLTANVSGVKSTAGSVAFLSGTAVVATVATDSNGNAVYAYVPTVGSYTITAAFTPTGGTSATITSAAAKFTVTQATPTIGLMSSATTGYAGTTSFTLTATVKSATTGTPSGAVAFYAGSTSLGSMTLTGNTASLTTTSLPAGTDCVTAVYSGDGNFVTVTSSCVNITVSPGFSVSSSTTALAFQPNYQEAQANLTINTGGRTDTLSFACQGLPAKLNCAFTPSTLTLAGGSATQSVQMLVSNSNATASLHAAPEVGFLSMRGIALAVLPFGALLLFGFRRRRLPLLMAFVLLALGAASTLSGCGISPTAREQTGGSYNFTVTVSSGSATLQTLNFTLTIPQS